MFVHLTKDFLKKLDAVEQRLAVSLDRDEIQTLGLKLRFYFNEVKHYQRLLNEVHARVIDIQDKYGFMPEKTTTGKASDQKSAVTEGKTENIATLVGDWISRLEKQGVDPKELLRGAGTETAPVVEDQLAAHSETHKPTAPPKEPHQSTPPEKTPPAATKTISPISAANIYRKTLPDTETEQETAPIIDMVHEASEPVFSEEPHIELKIEMEEPESILSDDVEATEISATKEDTSRKDILPSEDFFDQSTDLEIEPSEETEGTPPPEEAVEHAGESETADTELPETQQEVPAENETLVQHDVWEDIRSWAARIRNGTDPMENIKIELESYASRHGDDIVEHLSRWTEEGSDQRVRTEDTVFAGFCAAYLLKSSGRSGTAISILESVLRKNDGPAEAYKLLGDIYYNKELYKPALGAYSKVRKMDGDDSIDRADFMKCAKEAGDWDIILAETEQVPNDGDVDLLLLKAEALRAKGRHGEALRMLEKTMSARESGAEKARLALFLAKVLESKGDILGAIDCYEKCFETEPAGAEAHFELGRLYFKHNAIPLAKNQLMTILRKFPESNWADKARDFMAKEGVL